MRAHWRRIACLSPHALRHWRLTTTRVDADAFTSRFNDADAVQYFYEPFLEAFDPELRKELGVWYTPTEVITYMVARVDRALREELGVTDGLSIHCRDGRGNARPWF